MSTTLEDYSALITGGSSGMGFEMAKELASQGATVFITARDNPRLYSARDSLTSLGYKVQAIPMDVTDEASIVRAQQWLQEQGVSLDMVVCNAGIGGNAPGLKELPQGHHFFDIPTSAVKAVVDTNLVGFFSVARTFVPAMVERGHGSLVYVSTSTATMTRPGQLPYGPSKAGAEAMAVIMANELRETGVAVNIICPGGFTDTGMAGPGVKEFFVNNGLEVLAPTVLNMAISFLASPASAGITGEKLVGKDIALWLETKGISFEAP